MEALGGSNIGLVATLDGHVAGVGSAGAVRRVGPLSLYVEQASVRPIEYPTYLPTCDLF